MNRTEPAHAFYVASRRKGGATFAIREMKTLGIIVIASFALLVGCQPQPKASVTSSPAAAITQEQAKRIAAAAMGTSSINSQFVRVIPQLGTTSTVWRIQYAHPIAGAWEATVDKETGRVLGKREMPSR